MENLLVDSLPFWKDLSERQRTEMLEKTVEARQEKGTLLHYGGGECSGVELIKSGQIRVFITSPKGGEITLYRLLEGDVCILSAACMLKNLDVNISMEFEEDTHFYIIPKGVYKQISDENSSVKDYTLELVSEKFSDVMWLFNQYVFSNAANRLAGALMEHRALAGGNMLEITHDNLAKDMGTAREVVTRLLKQFQLDGIVRLFRGRIEILDVRKLGEI